MSRTSCLDGGRIGLPEPSQDEARESFGDEEGEPVGGKGTNLPEGLAFGEERSELVEVGAVERVSVALVSRGSLGAGAGVGDGEE